MSTLYRRYVSGHLQFRKKCPVCLRRYTTPQGYNEHLVARGCIAKLARQDWLRDPHDGPWRSFG